MDDRTLTDAVRRAGSIARTSTLLRLGASRHDLARAVTAGRLVRPSRGWVCLPDTDRSLQVAARAAVVLTCVTAAANLGLWVAQDVATPHVAAALHSTPRATHAVVHWRTPPVPRHPDALVDPIENVLVIAATCQPFEDALAMWETAVEKGLVTVEGMGRLALPPAARAVLAQATPWSGSGLESFIRSGSGGCACPSARRSGSPATAPTSSSAIDSCCRSTAARTSARNGRPTSRTMPH